MTETATLGDYIRRIVREEIRAYHAERVRQDRAMAGQFRSELLADNQPDAGDGPRRVHIKAIMREAMES